MASSWLQGCMICNDGLVNRMDTLIDGGISVRKASKLLAEEGERKIGTLVYSDAAIRARYLFYKGSTNSKVVGTQPPQPDPKTMDVGVYFYNTMLDEIDHEKGTGYIENLPRKKFKKLVAYFQMFWLLLINRPEIVEEWIAEVREKHPDHRITNGYHDGKMQCWCSKCKGRKTDMRDLVIWALKNPDMIDEYLGKTNAENETTKTNIN